MNQISNPRWQQQLPINNKAVAHRLVAETAIAMAHELYDALMQNNDWWKRWREWHSGASRSEMEKDFVRRNAAQMLPKARAVLAAMLAQPIDENLKESIIDALTLDATLRQGRLVN